MEVNLSDYEYFTEEVKHVRAFKSEKLIKPLIEDSKNNISSRNHTNDCIELIKQSKDEKTIHEVLKLPEIVKNKQHEGKTEENLENSSDLNILPSIVKSKDEKNKSNVFKKLRFDVDENNKQIGSNVRIYTPPYENNTSDSDKDNLTEVEIPKLVREKTVFNFKPTNKSNESFLEEEKDLVRVNGTKKVENCKKQEDDMESFSAKNDQKNNSEKDTSIDKIKNADNNEETIKSKVTDVLPKKQDKNLEKVEIIKTNNGSIENLKVEKRLSISNKVMQKTRYPAMVKMYLDQKWHNNRKQRFYKNLEYQQKFTQQERELDKLEQQKQNDCALLRQREQLLELRNKYEIEKEKRIQTQHVKFSLMYEVDKVDRSVYGLPNKKGTSNTIKQTKTADCKVSRSSNLSDIRRRNKARYEYMFKSTYKPKLSKNVLQLAKKIC